MSKNLILYSCMATEPLEQHFGELCNPYRCTFTSSLSTCLAWVEAHACLSFVKRQSKLKIFSLAS